jgi:nucleoside phosphorylase
MDGSKDARQTWDFLSTLPWATANGEHKNLPTSVRNWNSRMTTNASECDVVVLIAKKEEFRSFLPLLGEYEPDDDPKTGKSSYHSQVTGVDGQPIHLVALLVGGMGNERSVFWAQKLNEAMRPSILVNIGIAGGIHEDVRLGDVIVANQVENYLSDARAVPVKDGNGFVLDLAGDAFKTDASLVSIIQNFEFSHSGAFLAWRNECKRASQEIPSEKREMLIAKEFLRAEPRIEEGHVASGPIVGAAAAFVSWLKGKGDRSYLALEMESAGGGLAIHESATSTRHLVIRGISDFGDERKKELDSIGRGGVRNLAMQNATRLLITILQSVRMPIIRGLRI